MESPKPNRELHYGGYAVAVLDVLGQKEAIRKLGKIEPANGKDAELVRALKDSIGVRNGVREMFRKAYKPLIAESTDPRRYSLNEQQKADYDRYNQVQVKAYEFSDTIVAYFPIITSNGDPSIRDLYAVLNATASTILTCMAGKVPIRGGLELGFGLDWDGAEIYGPAFLSAYELGEHVAQYPRIVVGDEFVSYLQGLGRRPGDTPLQKGHRELARMCSQLIAKDEDGCFFIDYLGDAYRRVVGWSATTNVFELGMTFVKGEHERFVTERNSKLAARYASLRRYYESNASAWRPKH